MNKIENNKIESDFTPDVYVPEAMIEAILEQPRIARALYFFDQPIYDHVIESSGLPASEWKQFRSAVIDTDVGWYLRSHARYYILHHSTPEEIKLGRQDALGILEVMIAMGDKVGDNFKRLRVRFCISLGVPEKAMSDIAFFLEILSEANRPHAVLAFVAENAINTISLPSDLQAIVDWAGDQ